MKRKLLFLLSAILLLTVSCGKAEPASDNVASADAEYGERVPSENYISPASVYAADDGYVYAADATGGRIFKIASDGTIAAQIQLDGSANCIKTHDGLIYVGRGGLGGTLTVLDSELKVKSEITVGHTPLDVEFADGKAYVVNRFSDDITIVNLSDNSTTTVEVGREPMAAAYLNGKLYVACHLPEGAADEDKVSSNVYVVSADGSVKAIELCNGAGGVSDIAATPDGKYLFVTTVIARYQYPTTQLDGAWINSNGFAVIDASDDSYKTSILLDDPMLGAASPWGIAFDSSTAYFAASGVHEIVSVPLDKLYSILESNKNKGVELADRIGILDLIRTRTKLPGEGVRSISYANGKLYCGQYFTGDIAVMDAETFEITSISLGEQPAADIVRVGETLWYDATACYQYWESCASCHPNGRVDGFNWDNLNDGLGNPKSAASMTYTHRTPPVMTTGIRADAETAVRAGMKFIQFNTISEEDNKAIDEYLKSQLPEPSPALNLDGTLNETAKEGEELFVQYGCAECHPAPLYTDLEYHTSPILGEDGGWENRDFATPTLVEVWRTGPYMYNGSAATLEEAVTAFMPDGASEEDIAKIAEFVRSIGMEGEDYGVEQFWSELDGTVSQGRPAAGASVTGYTVRCQSKDTKPAYTTITVKNADGSVAFENQSILGEMQYNTAVKVNVENCIVPEGGSVEISITDKKGNALATTYVLSVKS
ncbi:MAG: hypothetical protein IJ497_13765 [Clostridia bacterium]|nr:hypothetical protein [Clostridia bacterium]